MSKKTANPTEEAAKAMTEAMEKLQKMGFGSMNTLGTEWMENMSDLGAEWMSFLSDRIQKDVDFQHKLLACKDMKELHEVQAEFLQTAIDRYTEETGKMIELSAKAFSAFQPKS